GRMAVAAPGTIEGLLPKTDVRSAFGHRVASHSLDEMIERRALFLKAYQNARYAAEYRSFVDVVRASEKTALGTEGKLSQAVARYLFKLMAYKDEYEVARLFSNGTFHQQLAEVFDGQAKLRFHLAPPILARTDAHTGEPVKMTFGPWMLNALRLIAPF